MTSTYKFAELCEVLSKKHFFVKKIQRTLSINTPHKQGYSEAYLKFMEKIVSLTALNISMTKIKELFETEKKILKLLHVDTLSNSETWYLDACDIEDKNNDSENKLLLTNYDLGFSLTANYVQHNLNFGEKEPELFKGVEMGEDVKRVIKKYLGLLELIIKIIGEEKKVLQKALDWANPLFLEPDEKNFRRDQQD